MNILHIVTAFKRSKSDIITPWMIDLLNGLTDKHNVYVLASGYGRIHKKQKMKSVKILRFNYAPSNLQKISHDYTINDFLKRHKNYYLLLPLFFITGCIEMYKLIKAYDIDVITVHWPYPMFFIYFPIQKILKIPVINVWYGAELKINRKHDRLSAYLIRMIARRANENIVISSHTDKLLKEAADNIETHIIPYGVNITELETSNKKKQIFFAGRLVERKGVEYLINAMDYIDSEYSLYIAGNGPLKEHLQNIINRKKMENRVYMLGYISDKELKQYYRESMVFVLPAIFDSKGDTEGLGMVLIEAIMRNTPVIATGIGGIRDIVIDNITGLFCEEKNSRDIAAKINLIINDSVLASTLTVNAHKHVTDNFSIEEIIKRFNEVYEKADK